MTYTVTNQWGGGFQASVKVTNNASAPINGWTLRWTFANGQVITQLWNGSFTQSAGNVAVTNLDYNRVIAANGGSAEFGFLASWNGTNAKPASFTVNNTACTAG